MTYNVDLYIDEVWVRTYYAIPGDSEADAVEKVESELNMDFYVESNE